MTDKEQQNNSLKNSDKNFNENYIHNKEQIMIDGVDVSQCCFHYYNKENKHKCIKTDVASTCDADCSYGAIYLKQQLVRKTQESEELQKWLDLYKNWYRISHDDIENHLGYYRKALEDIEKYCKNISVEENLYNSRHFYNGGVTVEVVNEILDIINKAKGNNNDR